MRVLVCGDRNWTNKFLVRALLSAMPDHTVVIHGGASGADSIADTEARKLGLRVKQFDADWNEYGKRAGPIRNRRMLDEGAPDVVFAFHEFLGASKGTADMVGQAIDAGIETWHVSGKSVTPLYLALTVGPPRRNGQLDYEEIWESMDVPNRVDLCHSSGVSGRVGAMNWQSILQSTGHTDARTKSILERAIRKATNG